jgi:hypothetical protein
MDWTTGRSRFDPCPDRLWDPPSLLSKDTGGPFPGVKARPGRDADTHPHLVLRSWISRIFSPLCLYRRVVGRLYLFTHYEALHYLLSHIPVTFSLLCSKLFSDSCSQTLCFILRNLLSNPCNTICIITVFYNTSIMFRFWVNNPLTMYSKPSLFVYSHVRRLHFDTTISISVFDFLYPSMF